MALLAPATCRLSLRATLAVLAALACPACTAGDGLRAEVIQMERPPEGFGLPPPADYQPCWSGEARAYDTNGDGRADRVRVSVSGKDRCYGEDTNHDGRIDTWDVLDESGNLTRRAHDSNGDGRIDQAWTFDPGRRGCATVAFDRDGDGRSDPGSAIDLCSAAGSAAPVVPAAAVAPAPAK